MSRTLRYCNRKNKTTPRYFHKYKFRRSYCRCDYCVDDRAEKHRREKNKLEIKREIKNLDTENVYPACVYRKKRKTTRSLA